MKALVLTSTNLRHRFFAQQVSRYFDVAAVICEEKKDYYVKQREESAISQEHFEKNIAAERVYFHDLPTESSVSVVSVADINAPELVQWASSLEVDAICLFGTSILKTPWLLSFPGRIVNLHLGLSPWYRGSATLFWPFADAAVEFVGTTIHLAVEKVDAGSILCRIRPSLRPGENYYQITHQLIRQSIESFPKVVSSYLDGKLLPKPQENVVGRICRKAHFNDVALSRALAYVGEGFSPEEIYRAEGAAKCLCLP